MKKELLTLSRMILKLAEIATDKGVLISDDEIEVGREVFIEDENGELIAAPNGEYLAEDRRIFIVEDGKVVEIREEEEKPEEVIEEPEVAPIEEPAEEALAEEEPEPEVEPEADEKDSRIADLEAKIEELNNIIVEKDAEIGRLKAELEKSEGEPAEEQLKSQKPETVGWFKPRF